MQCFCVEIFSYVCGNRYAMSIININKLVEKVGKNHYSYTRISNMFRGLKGRSTNKEIQQVRNIVKDELESILDVLDNLK